MAKDRNQALPNFRRKMNAEEAMLFPVDALFQGDQRFVAKTLTPVPWINSPHPARGIGELRFV